MAHIKEPEGVDFIIKSPPLTDQERKEISEYISRQKAANSKHRIRNTRRREKESVE